MGVSTKLEGVWFLTLDHLAWNDPVLHLPVAHSELNPIELARASVKRYVARHNKNCDMTEIQCLTPEGCTHTTTDMWRVFCSHVVDVENDYFVKDGLVEDLIEE